MQVLLILYLIMPGETPDMKHAKPMANMEECWKEAHKFTQGKPQDAGGIGLGAACIWKSEETKS